MPTASLLATMLVYLIAALAEIGGCFAVWSVVRSGASPWWLLAGLVSLAAFAGLLTLAEPVAAGRAYAAYGGIYILFALGWMVLVERVPATRADAIGALLCLGGCVVILFQRR